MNENIQWMDDIIIDVPSNKKLFKFIKFILGKQKNGITYKDLYVIYTNVYNFKKTPLNEIKEKAMNIILDIYFYNNKKYPI